jgi:hypothetical protein
MNHEVLDLSIIPIGNPLQCVEISLDHWRQLRIAAALQSVNVQRNRDWPIKAFEAKETSIVFSLSPELGFESRDLLLLASIGPLAQEAIASMEEDKLIGFTCGLVHGGASELTCQIPDGLRRKPESRNAQALAR